MAGFELKTFTLFPKAIGVVRRECVVLMVPDAETGLQLLGSPGWLIGEAIGVLTITNGRRVFQAKGDVVDATNERVEVLRQFQADLRSILDGERA